ncbi:bifunctional hydroxymethylpyrimidine kinase/phosphomethylpyrimidine kinase [Dyadobacter sp. CY107]|uniref:bifunctional hydroxymethylpyrimidine kinase/phosphomethylpyrimidine kinase n=1 Tax=Dyadobacter fanqingshengii TaxID=2906443 RepID=UPI001F3FD043|nr:bifunctional hydroxymethylpyrimidine kinase/phosphomethylpyrimidine kinase [Dyadobacter fanqingshengii]MCF2503139.1 bifunctional hydroxymethylpyrimidine kinase/phosphomethylpyrimidine kinase [Dyadobacter fanqingshengii]
MNRYPTILTIAGSDSCGGAGIQADLKTIGALGGYGTSAITALTAQNTMEVRTVFPVPAVFLREQLLAVLDDIQVDAIKVGMIGTVENALVIADIIEQFKPGFVVIDPVMASSSGTELAAAEMLSVFWERLFPIADLVTPNMDEAKLLLSRKIDSLKTMQEAASEMIAKGCRAVLLKGGHLVSERLFDVLAQKDQEVLVFESAYIASENLHGTGCTLSSAIATFMAQGNSLPEAIIFAKEYISSAIEAGKNAKTGNGNGPLNHFFDPIPLRVLY